MTLIGLNGAAFQLVNHVILSSMMFLCAGAIEMKTGTLEFDNLGGLAPEMPALATVFVIGSLALAGTPPLSTFAGEWMIFAGAAERAAFGGIGQAYYLAMTIFGVIITALTAGYYLWAIRRIFYGPIQEGLENVRDPPAAILAIVGCMALAVITLGVWPWLLWRFVNPVLSSLYGVG